MCMYRHYKTSAARQLNRLASMGAARISIRGVSDQPQKIIQKFHAKTIMKHNH